MRETQHGSTSQGQSSEEAQRDQGAGATPIVHAMLARNSSVAEIANVIREHPGDLTAILRLLHQMMGNSYVQQLIAALSAPATPSAPAGPAPDALAAGSSAALPIPSDASTRVRVTAQALNVRSAPRSDVANVIGGLHSQQIVTVMGHEGGWFRFDYQGRVGYIYGRYVEPAGASPAAPSTAAPSTPATAPSSPATAPSSPAPSIPGASTPTASSPAASTAAPSTEGAAAEPGSSSHTGGAPHAAQDTGAQAAAGQAAAPADHTATNPAENEWVSSAPPPDAAGEQKYSSTSATKAQIFDAITQVAPGLPHDVRVMLLGQAWLEQQGKNIINNNFAGMEGGSASYVMARTSAVISRSEYEANPSKYSDWGKGNVYGGKDAGTIDVQLARGETKIVVMTRKRRPAYASLASAAAAFVHNVEAKFHKLQASTDPVHQALVNQAFGGDAHAYAKVVSLSVPKLGIYPYNPDIGYPARVIAQIELARKDLASRPPAAE